VENKLYLNLVWMLAEAGGGGDVAGGVAYAPTKSALNAYEEQLKLLGTARNADKLMAEVAAFNKANAGKITISDKMAEIRGP
jgi:hypothetical protein